MKWYSQTYTYDDPWPTVTLAYFLRYPNPFASHILSCDVISRSITPEGRLKSTRLLLKKGVLPKWTRKFVTHPEAWVVEESEVDLDGKTVHCVTRNLNHVKVLQVVENLQLKEIATGKTSQYSDARLFSGIGWGLSKRIESLGLNKVKTHIQRSPETISFILNLIHTSRLQPLTLSSVGISPACTKPSESSSIQTNSMEFARTQASHTTVENPQVVSPPPRSSRWTSFKTVFQWR